MKRKNSFIKIELVDKIAKLIEGKQKMIWLHFWGEPLLHPRLFDVMFILKSYGISSCLYTNGKLLSGEINNKLSKAPIRSLVITMNMFAPMKQVEELIKMCEFEVRPVFLMGVEGKLKRQEYSEWCKRVGIDENYSDYDDPLWSNHPKKCFYQTKDGLCALKRDNKVNVTSEGKAISCVKDYGHETCLGEVEDLTDFKYKDFKCPYL